VNPLSGPMEVGPGHMAGLVCLVVLPSVAVVCWLRCRCLQSYLLILCIIASGSGGTAVVLLYPAGHHNALVGSSSNASYTAAGSVVQR
jgi:hypothetical protein